MEKTYTGHPNGSHCLVFGITLDPENYIGVLCMLSCRLRILFKASVSILISYDHRIDNIALGHIFFAWIIMDIDSSDNHQIIFSNMTFVWWEFTPTNVILCPQCSHSDIHLFSLNMPLPAWYGPTWRWYCLKIPSKYILYSIVSSVVDVLWKLVKVNIE